MTYYGAKELAESFRTVRKNTIRAAEEIPESHYGFQAAPETMTVERTLVHLALTFRFQEMFHGQRRKDFEGLDFAKLFEEFRAEQAKPRTKDEVLALLNETGEVWAGFLAGLNEEFLAEIVTMPVGSTPATKSRFEMVLSVQEHEMHHPAHIMLIPRMTGIVPHLTREMQARMAQMQAAQARSADTR